jgi:phage tail protein X
MTAAGETVISREGDTLDLVLWRNRGRTAALTEQALDLNPGLAARGPVLPAGVAIVLPAATAPASVRETVKLWG